MHHLCHCCQKNAIAKQICIETVLAVIFVENETAKVTQAHIRKDILPHGLTQRHRNKLCIFSAGLGEFEYTSHPGPGNPLRARMVHAQTDEQGHEY
jgi:hypothetical protein